MDIVTKDFPVIAGKETEDSPHGTFEVILSAPTQDRDGEIVDSKAFEPLPDHITFDTDHSMTCDSVVGSGVPSYDEDGTLRVKGSYAQDERSQIIRQKVLDGHIRTTSVTFMAATRVKDAKGVDHVTKAELINGTFTPVPSNRESVVLASKSILAHDLAEKVGARNSASDATTIQSMHDATVGLGAACETKGATAADDKSLSDAVTKALAGSYEQRESSVYDAVSGAYTDHDNDVWAYPVATFDDNVVFRVSGGDDAGTWRATYTLADDGTATLGTPEKVVVTEVITTVSDTDQSADEAASDSAAQAAETDTAKSADEGSVMSASTALLEQALNARLLSGS